MKKLLGLVSLAIIFFSCSGETDSSVNSGIEPGTAAVLVSIKKQVLKKSTANAAPPEVDSIEISITCTDMAAQIQGFKTSGSQVEMRNVLPGTNCLTEVFVFDPDRILIYKGSKAGTDITAGKTTEIQVSCTPQFSELHAIFSLGIGNSTKIDSGSLQLINGGDTVSSRLTLINSGEIGEFYIPRVKGNLTYSLLIRLMLADGTIVYEEKPGTVIDIPMGTSVVFDLDLANSLGRTLVPITLLPESQVKLNITTSDAVKRVPGPKEIIFTEFYPSAATEDGGEDGEWVELYNRTIDSLILNECRIAKTRTTTGATSRHLIGDEAPVTIPPGGVIVFGRDSVAFRDYTYAFNMTGTKMDILLLCDENGTDILIDSISYTSTTPAPADSIEIKSGNVASLKNDKFGGSSEKDNWCLTKMSTDDVYPLATPGEILSNCP